MNKQTWTLLLTIGFSACVILLGLVAINCVINSHIESLMLQLPQKKQRTYYVDRRVKKSGDGRQWTTAFKTINEAIKEIKKNENVPPIPMNNIFIGPGIYEEYIAGLPDCCAIIGVGNVEIASPQEAAGDTIYIEAVDDPVIAEPETTIWTFRDCSTNHTWKDTVITERKADE